MWDNSPLVDLLIGQAQVPEQLLPRRLVVGLPGQFLAVQPERAGPLRGLSAVIVPVPDLTGQGVRVGWERCSAGRADPGSGLEVRPTASRAGPRRVGRKGEPDHQPPRVGLPDCPVRQRAERIVERLNEGDVPLPTRPAVRGRVLTGEPAPEDGVKVVADRAAGHPRCPVREVTATSRYRVRGQVP